jgi:hypothetical protein
MAEATLKIDGVTQDTTDPTRQNFILRFSRNLTHSERETVPAFLSLQFLPTEVNGPDAVVIRKARPEFFFDPEIQKRIKAAVAGAEAQAEKNLSQDTKAEGQAAARAEETKRRLEEIDWDEDDS